MKKKILTLMAYGIGFYLVYAVLTGGVDIAHTRSFGGQTKVAFAGGGGECPPRVYVLIRGKVANWSMPFVAHYSHMGHPYAVRLEIWDDMEVYSKVLVMHIVVRFDDGGKVTSETAWEGQFEDMSMGWGVLARIPNVFQRYANGTIKIQGELEKKDGTVIPFTVEERFVKQPEFSVTTFWYALSRL